MGNRFSGRPDRRRAATITTIDTLDPRVLENSPPLFPIERPSAKNSLDDEKTFDVDDGNDHKNSVSTTTSTPSRHRPQPPTNTPPLPPRRSTGSGDTSPELQGISILIRSPTDPRVLLPVSSLDASALPEIIAKWTTSMNSESFFSPVSPYNTLSPTNGLQVLDDPDFGRSHSAPADLAERSRSGTRTLFKSATTHKASPVPVPDIFAMDHEAKVMPLNDTAPKSSIFPSGRMNRSASMGHGRGMNSKGMRRARSASINFRFPKFRGRSSTQLRKYPRFFESRLVDCPPQVYIHICSFLEVKSVCRMASVCRYLYIIGNNKELWRQLVRRDMHGYIRRKRKQEIAGSTDAPRVMNRKRVGAMTISGVKPLPDVEPGITRAKSLPSLVWINRHDAYRAKKEKVKRPRKKGRKHGADSPTSSPQSSPPAPLTRPSQPNPPDLEEKMADTPVFDDDLVTPRRRGLLRRLFSRRTHKTKHVSLATGTPPPPNFGSDSLEDSSSPSNHFDPEIRKREATLTDKSVTLSEPKGIEDSPNNRHVASSRSLDVASVIPLTHTRAHSYMDIQFNESLDKRDEEEVNSYLSPSGPDPEYSQSESEESSRSFDPYLAADTEEIFEEVDQEDLELEQRIPRTPLAKLDGEHPRSVYKILQMEINNKKRLKEARKQREHLINSLRMAGLY